MYLYDRVFDDATQVGESPVDGSFSSVKWIDSACAWNVVLSGGVLDTVSNSNDAKYKQLQILKHCFVEYEIYGGYRVALYPLRAKLNRVSLTLDQMATYWQGVRGLSVEQSEQVGFSQIKLYLPIGVSWRVDSLPITVDGLRR